MTFAPGFTNTLSAIQNANMSNSPLILIAGAHGRKAPDRLGLQDMKQEPIIQLDRKEIACVRPGPNEFRTILIWLFAMLRADVPGPVFLELPIDVLTAKVEAQDVPIRHTIVESRPVDSGDVRKMMAIIRDSKKPIIITGSGAYYSDAGAELTLFAEKTGIPVFTSKFSRGIMPDTHPLCFGSSVVITPGCAIWATLMSDCVIILGTRLCLYQSNGELYNPEARIIQVDIEPEEIGRNRSSDLAVFADIKGLLHQCNQYVDEERIGSTLQKTFASWVDELKKKTRNEKSFKNLIRKVKKSR